MPSPGALVIDCSVTMTWCFEDEACTFGEAVLDALADSSAVVPTIWPLEVANALLMAERRNRTTQASTLLGIELLGALPIRVDEETSARAFRDIVLLARESRLTVYDAAYLALSVRRGLPLATLDTRLQRAAESVGVELYTPPRA